VKPTVAFWLVTIGWIQLLMTEFLFLSKRLPLIFHFRWLILPLLSDDLGDLRIC